MGIWFFHLLCALCVVPSTHKLEATKKAKQNRIICRWHKQHTVIYANQDHYLYPILFRMVLVVIRLRRSFCLWEHSFLGLDLSHFQDHLFTEMPNLRTQSHVSDSIQCFCEFFGVSFFGCFFSAFPSCSWIGALESLFIYG